MSSILGNLVKIPILRPHPRHADSKVVRGREGKHSLVFELLLLVWLGGWLSYLHIVKAGILMAEVVVFQ